ncbi:MAG: glycosyltransferase family 39 protein [Hyphomicrobium sp.]|nr:glycosyltransferase family 39 protein [Hyphomicrobium sp.]
MWLNGSMSRLRTSAPILGILLVAALARTWHLSQNDYGRQYYAAAVRSMMESWHAFLFNSFDAAGFVTIDKPPVAIWLQTLSAKLLGFSGHSILMAQVVAGLIAVLLTYLMVRRTFGPRAAAWSALFLALTPVSIAVDRSNNTESSLIVVLLLAAWLAMRAAETGRLARLCGAMGILGIGFNIKMGAALVLAPVIALTFSLAWRDRPILWHLTRQAVAGIVLIAVALSWVSYFDLVSPSQRPYAGSTKHNSMLELALIHNGAARFLKPKAEPPETTIPAAASTPASVIPEPDTVAPPLPALYDDSPTGFLRLLRPRAAKQMAWMLPLALVGVALAWLAPITLAATSSRFISAGIWTGWLVSYWIVLSFAGGPVHTYYVAILGPPLAVFTGIAIACLYERWRSGLLPRWGLPLLAVLMAAWQSYLFFGQEGVIDVTWLRWIWLTSIGIVLACSLLLVARPNLARLAAVSGAAALLVLPGLTAASVVIVRPNVAVPVANMASLANPPDARQEAIRRLRQNAARQKLVRFLTDNRQGETFLVAVPNANVAAPLIIETGLPVMAMGGYLGDDPILTPQALERLVAYGRIRYVMLGGFTLAPESTALDAIGQWVRANGRRVDQRQWSLYRRKRDAPYHIRRGNRWIAVPPPELFDMRPDGQTVRIGAKGN